MRSRLGHRTNRTILLTVEADYEPLAAKAGGFPQRNDEQELRRSMLKCMAFKHFLDIGSGDRPIRSGCDRQGD